MNEMTIGKRIQALRKERGMTQKQLADAVGVTPQAVSKWETDESCPDITALPLLASTLGVSVDMLLSGEESANGPVYSGVVTDANEPCNKEKSYIKVHNAGKVPAILGGVFLLLAGVLLILFKTNNAWFGDVGFWDIAWPSLIIFVGLGGCSSRDFSVFSLGIVAFGVLFLLKNLGFVTGNIWPIAIAIVLFLVGISTILQQIFRKKKRVCVGDDHRNGKARSDYHDEGGFIRYNASFSEDRVACHADILTGGAIGTSFGEYHVSLKEVRTVADGAQLNANISFGELTIHMPKHIRVEVETSGAFSGKQVEGNPAPDAPYVLRIKASASFGEFSVVYDD